MVVAWFVGTRLDAASNLAAAETEADAQERVR